MSLNIKNERVCAMARRAAELTGRTQTSVIESALERLLADLDEQTAATHRADRVRAALARLDMQLTDDDRRRMRRAAEDLHDESGLPA